MEDFNLILKELIKKEEVNILIPEDLKKEFEITAESYIRNRNLLEEPRVVQCRLELI